MSKGVGKNGTRNDKKGYKATEKAYKAFWGLENNHKKKIKKLLKGLPNFLLIIAIFDYKYFNNFIILYQ